MADAQNYSLEEMDRQSFFHPATSIADHLRDGPTIIGGGGGPPQGSARARFDRLRRRLVVRQCRIRPRELGAAAAQAMADLGYYHTFASYSNEPIIRVADRVLALFREKAGAGHLSKVFFGTSGSDANDTNFKLVPLLQQFA